MNLNLTFLDSDDPDPSEGENWVLVEEDSEGRWYGTGFGVKADGTQSIYISMPEDDDNYDRALKAASDWANENSVEKLYIRRI